MPFPNLFDTLSPAAGRQAFFAWLVQWAHPDHNGQHPLHDIARGVIAGLLGTSAPGVPMLQPEWNQLDLLVTFHDAEGAIVHVLAVATSVTSEHKVRLPTKGKGPVRRHLTLDDYGPLLQKRFPDVPTTRVYLQLHDEHRSRLSEGWTLVDRARFLDLLEPGMEATGSDILTDFAGRLRRTADAVEAWKTSPSSDWDTSAWLGYIASLAPLVDGSWTRDADTLQLRWGWCDGVQPLLRVGPDREGLLQADVSVRADGRRQNETAQQSLREAIVQLDGWLPIDRATGKRTVQLARFDAPLPGDADLAAIAEQLRVVATTVADTVAALPAD